MTGLKVTDMETCYKAFKGDLNYSGFINALETELNKGGELADAISEVKYDNGFLLAYVLLPILFLPNNLSKSVVLFISI